jgi:alkyldihydroxyacetonephosphate synthase
VVVRPGTVEDAVCADERRALLDRVRALLPDADLTLHEPPDLAALDVLVPRIPPAVSLARICSAGTADRLAQDLLQ